MTSHLEKTNENVAPSFQHGDMNIAFNTFDMRENVVYPVFDRGTSKATFAKAPADMVRTEKFTGKSGQVYVVPGEINKIYLGMGTPESLTANGVEEIGAKLQQALANHSFKEVLIHPVTPADARKGAGANAEEIAAHLASGAVLKNYSFNKYKTPPKEENKQTALNFLVTNPNRANAAFAKLDAVARGVYLARDLANEPPNVAYPEAVAKMVRDAFHDSNVIVKIFKQKELEDLKAGGILAVGQGSRRPPCMVVMEYDGTNGKNKRPDLALVGKGVTFDTGGISIKPAGGMEDMKYDMSGAADVAGTMLALSRRHAKTHVVGIIGLAENMPDGNAYRPGDVIRLMSGKSVEIVNTDAEGRLVLSDCLTYVEKTYKPKAIIDFATLTGACIAALGHTFAAVITRDEKLERKIIKAGRAVNELCHPLPLHADFTSAVKASKIADIKNQAAGPGTSTAAAFLEQAVLNKTPWAHLDIAGMAWNGPSYVGPANGTASGFGVRLTNRLISDNFEIVPHSTSAPRADRKLSPGH